MASFDRSKKKIQVWKKAVFHFSICFVMGVFTGFAPTNMSPIFTIQISLNRSYSLDELSPQPIQEFEELAPARNSNRSLMTETPVGSPIDWEAQDGNGNDLIPRRPLIIVTTTRSKDPFEAPFLRKLANTLKLIPPPVLWIVVQSSSESLESIEMVRKTGIMYRHLIYKENFTDQAIEMDHQRNVALNHIERHRLDGIVHFAEASSVYDLDIFEEIRGIEVFGTWPVALLSASRKRFMVEGPICTSSHVVGWKLRNSLGDTDGRASIHTSSFAFNSSVLWDPERWGRASSVQDTSQDSIKFVQQTVLEDGSKLMGIPQDCSKIMLWHLNLPTLRRSFASPSNYTRR